MQSWRHFGVVYMVQHGKVAIFAMLAVVPTGSGKQALLPRAVTYKKAGGKMSTGGYHQTQQFRGGRDDVLPLSPLGQSLLRNAGQHHRSVAFDRRHKPIHDPGQA